MAMSRLVCPSQLVAKGWNTIVSGVVILPLQAAALDA
jgi:hypothetical protein